MISELPFYLFHLLNHNIFKGNVMIQIITQSFVYTKSFLFTDGVAYLLFRLKGKNYTQNPIHLLAEPGTHKNKM